jgi:hypothetical protein
MVLRKASLEIDVQQFSPSYRRQSKIAEAQESATSLYEGPVNEVFGQLHWSRALLEHWYSRD